MGRVDSVSLTVVPAYGALFHWGIGASLQRSSIGALYEWPTIHPESRLSLSTTPFVQGANSRVQIRRGCDFSRGINSAACKVVCDTRQW